MALKIYYVTILLIIFRSPEMVEGHFPESSCRGVGRNVSTNSGKLTVGADDHRHRVPSNPAFDSMLDFTFTRVGRCVFGTDCINVGCTRRLANLNAVFLCRQQQLFEKLFNPPRAACAVYVGQRLQPFAVFKGFEFWVRVRHTQYSLLSMPVFVHV